MPYRFLTIAAFLILTAWGTSARQGQAIKLTSSKESVEVLPGQSVNLAFFAENITDNPHTISTSLQLPDSWRQVLSAPQWELKPGEKKLLLYTIQIPSGYPVGKYSVSIQADAESLQVSPSPVSITVAVAEVEKVTLHLVQSPPYIRAGETFRAEFLLQNHGNTEKKVYLETRNCEVEGPAEVTVKPGQSVSFFATETTSAEITETSSRHFTVRSLLGNEVTENIFKSYRIFPVKEKKTDLYFRYPAKFSTTYLASNQRGNYEHILQFELSGSGSIDQEGRHRIDFLARGPNNANLSYLGMYDQYFISYTGRNLELFAGEKSFMFTPLTESSRFGMGAESRVILNNGLNFGFMYVEPRFYQEIRHEMAAFTGFEFNPYTSINLYLISKQPSFSNDNTQLASLTSKFRPFNRTSAEVEYSIGRFREKSDQAMRLNVNSQFSLFNLSGQYYYTGKNYPGYYSNSTFYSGNLSARLTKKLNLGFYAREDFRNARLDTFFVTAPYSNSFHSSLNYNIAPRTYLRLYWRQYERKDRLAQDKFHYKTNSVNTQFNQGIRRFEYNLLGEFGETTNYLIASGQNRQKMVRGSLNLAYRFNASHAVRIFGSYTNVNRFISNHQQNFMGGFSAISNITKNLQANVHLQNTYSIEDYYRNRNLMQVNLEYKPNKNHQISLRSYYTMYRQKTDNPELTFSVNYAYSFGIPLKKILKAGELRGRLIDEDGNPAEGVFVYFSNKTAVSDANGSFNFKSVPAGRHVLLIDKSGLAIDALPEVADHFEVDITDEGVVPITVKITRGARLSGRFIVQQSELNVLKRDEARAQNIIIELSNENEQYRITTGEEGKFAFPLVRPGDWSFRVYTSSLPEGYEVVEQFTTVNLQPGQKQTLDINLRPKKRTIIFKSEGNTLKPLQPINNRAENQDKKESEPNTEIESTSWYSVQVGAFSQRLNNDSEYFNAMPFDFIKQADNLYKYFIGRFSSVKEALDEQKRLKKIYNNPFVVKMENELTYQYDKN